jgi:hypothetical protein
MTAKEMELYQKCEHYRMKAAEFEKSDAVVKKFMGILENIMQEIDDRRIKSDDFFERIRLHNEWKGLNRFKKELDKMMEGE